MSYKEEVHGDVYVLSLKGKLMGGSETAEVHDRIKQLSQVGVKRVVLDLGGVKWMNSSGLGALMSSMTTMKNGGGDLRLSSVAEKVESLLIITQLLKIFKTYENVDSAVKSYHEA
ncbi:MAG: STAS domain-containing protein [Bacteroidetes bacterium]|nr:STAS domain-containing protein [Bacteroidota bacterium]